MTGLTACAASIDFDTALAVLVAHAKPLLGLPGNPTAALTTARLFLAQVNALVRRPACAPPILPGVPVPTLPLCC